MSKSYIIRNATLIEKGHSHNSKKVDILITKGQVAKIGKDLASDAQEITGDDLYVSSGWVDLRCHLTDPGMEYKDTATSLLDTAATGGYTAIVTLPHSSPTISDKSAVNYLIKSSEDHLVQLLPTGTISTKEDQENLAELYDMHTAGAKAFTNGDKGVSNGLLKKSLLYTKPFGGRIITHPCDKTIEQNGIVNESSTTIHTGLKTAPSLAEYINVQEQIEIAKYCDASLHFSCISTKESVNLIRTAKKSGIAITCDVAIANLCFTDKEVLDFNENFKLYPPLRTEEDRTALIDGINDGTIDAISSNHSPQNIESKLVEFDYADYGALSLQLTYPWYLKHLAADIDFQLFVELLTSNPNELLGLASTSMQEGNTANITVLDRSKTWTLDKESNSSFSKNTHEWKKEQLGKVIAVFNNNKVKL